MKKNNLSNLFLFTSTYPYGKGESFLETEILYLSHYFKYIYIFPRSNEDGAPRSLPENAEVVDYTIYHPYSRLRLLKTDFFIILNLWLNEIATSSDWKQYFLHFKKLINYLMLRVNNANRLKQTLNELDIEESAVIYSYWFNTWMEILSIMRFKKLIPNLITRVHGGDLYRERKKSGFFPFRSIQIKGVDHINSISENGKKYLVEQYNRYQHKINCSRLGVIDKGNNPLPYVNEVFHIVSCSYMIELKRVHLIIEILKHVPFKIKWTHFGDGPLENEVLEKSKTLPDNVICEFRGSVPNTEVILFYNKSPVHLFINVSNTEGIPVSIMEAISFGIPAMATNVGGVSEIVNEQTGFLINKDFDPKETADIIIKYYNNSEYWQEVREMVKKFWYENYDAARNYDLFIKNYLLKQ